MKLARALPKTWDDLPEWAKCCQVMRDYCTARHNEGPIIIDLDRTKVYENQVCKSCENPMPSWQAVMVIDSKQPDKKTGWCPIEVLDIDEAPYENPPRNPS